jgi:ribosome-associated protein
LATKKLSAVVIDALEDIKARDIKLINVSKLTSVFDYIAIASADSSRQTKALAHNVIDKVKENGGWIYGIEGQDSGEWVLVDCGDIVVHVMQPAVREHYKLEEFWGEGKVEFPKPVVEKKRAEPVKAKSKKAAPAKKKPVTAKAKAKVKTTTTTTTTKRKAATAKTAVAKAKATTKSKTTAVATAAKVTKKKAAVATTKVAKKPAATKVAKKPVATKVAKKPAATTVKKKTATVKKAVAKKPAVRKRKAAAD